ncbi:MAG: hypothetical protein JNJ54_12155 [Myxococcaceae bacterium]|nr:hypothetical protein [Myxococcaceae bacterium]
MSSFAELARPVVSRHCAIELKQVFDGLGADVASELQQLDLQRRAALVDQLVRNLRGLSVAHGPRLERELLSALGAEPTGVFEWELMTPTSLVNLRSGIKYLATWLGYDWADLSRLQAVLCGVARWVQASGSGSLTAAVEPRGVRFEFRLSIPGFEVKTVESSPFVTAINDVAQGFAVRDDSGTAVVSFHLTQR